MHKNFKYRVDVVGIYRLASGLGGRPWYLQHRYLNSKRGRKGKRKGKEREKRKRKNKLGDTMLH